jgi:hypothetical protein
MIGCVFRTLVVGGAILNGLENRISEQHVLPPSGIFWDQNRRAE